MNARRLASRPTRGLARVVAVALTAFGAVGTVGASPSTPTAASTATPTSTPTGASAPPGAALVKEVSTDDGMLAVYRSGDPAEACNGVDPKVCLAVSGSGLAVSTVVNSTYYGAGASADLQIKSPSGAVVAETSFYASAGGWYSATYAPDGYVAAGRWCGLSNANGGVYTGTCVNVTN
ncbi:hypothetical protein [Kitasatospora sp. NPDC017646]|uniref:hypothetical protein n=1 Tax=Kitasatospora sp. NPDC017646 TaxID=3364024 RepID=UPI0037A78EB0